MAIPTEKPSYGPLDGVKVVYAAVELACPKAADLMADRGADVTWLENTGAGDTIRDTAYIKQAAVSYTHLLDEGVLVPVEFGQWLDLRHSNLLRICCKYTVNKQNWHCLLYTSRCV